jgi:hypothetical protein
MAKTSITAYESSNEFSLIFRSRYTLVFPSTFCLSYLVLQGFATIQRAIINVKEKDDAKGQKGDKELLVEGYGLQKCIVTEGRLRFIVGVILNELLDQALSENTRRPIM